MKKKAHDKLLFRSASYSSPIAGPMIGEGVWKDYQKLRAAQKAKIVLESNSRFARLASTLKSQKPLRTLVLENLDFAATKRNSGQRFSRGVSANALPVAYDSPWFLNRALAPPDCFFDHQGGYYAAKPNPEFIVRTKGNMPRGIGSTEIESYADALTGNISLGFAGGNWLLDSGKPFFSSPMSIPALSNSPFPCDGIYTAGSVYDLTDLSTTATGPAWAPPAHLVVTASVHCAVDNNDQLTIRPGSVSSPASGLVILTANLNLTISYISGGRIVQSTTASRQLLQVVANSGAGPYGTAFNILADHNAFLLSQNMSQAVTLQASLPLGDSIPHLLLTEVEVELVGLRAGNHAQGAGYIGMSFQDWKPNTITPIYGLETGPRPFKVVGISACVGP
jgi:hypothetical protein